jgi:hypothetical protein
MAQSATQTPRPCEALHPQGAFALSRLPLGWKVRPHPPLYPHAYINSHRLLWGAEALFGLKENGFEDGLLQGGERKELADSPTEAHGAVEDAHLLERQVVVAAQVKPGQQLRPQLA